MRVDVLSCGHCVQSETFVKGNGSLRKIEFPSSVVVVEHPKHGVILFDTGYTNSFIEATKRFPERLYAVATPVTISDDKTAKSQLLGRGIKPQDVRHVVISHFHADHVAGLRDFPQATFHFMRAAFRPFEEWSRFKQVSKGYLRGVLPDDFAVRSRAYDEDRFRSSTGLSYMNQAFFLFGDEGIGLVPLPGHSDGHMGLLLREGSKTALFVGDACWHRDNFLNDMPPMRLTISWLGDYQEYKETLSRVERFAETYPEAQIIPCHCSDSHQTFEWRDGSG